MAYFLQSLQYSNSASNAISTHLRNNHFSKTPLGNCNVYHKPSPNSSLDEILTSKNRKFGFSLRIDQQSNPSITTSTNLGMGGTRKIQRYDLYNTHTLCHFHSHDGNKTKKLHVDINNVGAVNSISSTQLGGTPDVLCDTGSVLPLTGLDLSNRNFSDTLLCNVDFSGTTLTGVDFSGSYFSNVNFTSVKSFAGINFTGVDLNAVRGSTGEDSPFIDMSFNGTTFGEGYGDINFKGANFTHANFPQDLRFNECNLSNADFSDISINNFNIITSDDIGGLNLSSAKIGSLSVMGARTVDPFATLIPANLKCAGLVVGPGSMFMLRGDIWSMTSSIFNNASLIDVVFGDVDAGVDGGADLSGSQFIKANLTNANLTNANLTNIDLSGANLTNAILTNVTLTNATLTNAKLTNVDLTNLDLSGANLTNVDLTNFDLTGANLTNANLTNANLTNAILTNVTLTNATLTNANLTNVDLTNRDFSGANLTNIEFVGANLTNANLTNANLTGVTLTNATLTNANLTNVDLTNHDLSGANLTNVDLTNHDLTGANLTNANLTNANLTNATLTNVTLTNANLTNVDLNNRDFSGANLTNIEFVGANLTNANLTNANLTNANLTNANLTGANITGVNFAGVTWRGTTCPTGANTEIVGPCCYKSASCTPTFGCNFQTQTCEYSPLSRTDADCSAATCGGRYCDISWTSVSGDWGYAEQTAALTISQNTLEDCRDFCVHYPHNKTLTFCGYDTRSKRCYAWDHTPKPNHSSDAPYFYNLTCNGTLQPL